MIERLAWRTSGFVGTTAERTLRSVARMLPGAQPPPRKPRLLRALPTVAGTALGLAAGVVTASGRSGAVRSGPSSGGAGRTRNGSPSRNSLPSHNVSPSRNGSPSRNSSPSHNGSHTRNATSGGGRSRPSAAGGSRRAAGATKDLAEKSRQELYELARKAGIEGRSAMSKKELARALSR
jgi:hypothetical protein